MVEKKVEKMMHDHKSMGNRSRMTGVNVQNEFQPPRTLRTEVKKEHEAKK